MILPDTEGKLIPFKDFIEQLQLPENTPGDSKRDQVINYLATQPEQVMNDLLKKVMFSAENGFLRAAVSTRRKELEAGQKQIGITGVEMAAGAGVGVLSVAEILSNQHEVIFKGTEREFHCPLPMTAVIDAIETKFAQEIESGKLNFETQGKRLFFKDQQRRHLLTVILQSGQQESAVYPEHPIATTVLKISQANLELLQRQLVDGLNEVLDTAIEHADDNHISLSEGISIGLQALSAFAPAARTGGIGSQVLSVIAQELDKAERAYKVKRESEIGQALDKAEADKAQRQCMFCGVERIKNEVSCPRCGGAYTPAKS